MKEAVAEESLGFLGRWLLVSPLRWLVAMVCEVRVRVRRG